VLGAPKAWAYSLVEGEDRLPIATTAAALRPRLGSYAKFTWLRLSGRDRGGVRRPPEAPLGHPAASLLFPSRRLPVRDE
jgi:hypothetical protein